MKLVWVQLQLSNLHLEKFPYTLIRPITYIYETVSIVSYYNLIKQNVGRKILGELGKFHWQLDEIRKNSNSIEFNIKALFTICKDLGENTAELGNLSSIGNEKVLINP